MTCCLGVMTCYLEVVTCCLGVITCCCCWMITIICTIYKYTNKTKYRNFYRSIVATKNTPVWREQLSSVLWYYKCIRSIRDMIMGYIWMWNSRIKLSMKIVNIPIAGHSELHFSAYFSTCRCIDDPILYASLFIRFTWCVLRWVCRRRCVFYYSRHWRRDTQMSGCISRRSYTCVIRAWLSP